uniref:Prokineticin domain-containing protein n=1 Tax=Poecilia mexicana TaxID=48701 RepID=A0A3B3WE89_9TELE
QQKSRYICFLLFSPSPLCFLPTACEKDEQCGHGECCAVSLWKSNQRMCMSLGVEGDDCHPLSFKVPYSGIRKEHTCPCLPHLTCKSFYDLSRGLDFGSPGLGV